jgi:hypothetical protein
VVRSPAATVSALFASFDRPLLFQPPVVAADQGTRIETVFLQGLRHCAVCSDWRAVVARSAASPSQVVDGAFDVGERD